MSRHITREFQSGSLVIEAAAEQTGGVCSVRTGELLAEEISCVRIGQGAMGSWRVEVHADGIAPYDSCYLASSLNGALRVAGLLLRGEPVPPDYRNWS